MSLLVLESDSYISRRCFTAAQFFEAKWRFHLALTIIDLFKNSNWKHWLKDKTSDLTYMHAVQYCTITGVSFTFQME